MSEEKENKRHVIKKGYNAYQSTKAGRNTKSLDITREVVSKQEQGKMILYK